MIDFKKLPFRENDMVELSKLNIDFAFQPIFATRDMQLMGYEALMRPQGKSPLELISEYGREDKLAVIELATFFGATMAYKERGYKEKLCINSFPSEYMDMEQARLYFEEFSDIASKLVIEIVEYTKLNQQKWNKKQADIITYGMGVSVDDFSTGNNDISVLSYLSPDYAKLDRSLITDIHKDEEKQRKVSELVRVFKERNIMVIAEGIETEDELNYLRNRTMVDYLQGYYLGVPA